MSASFTIYEVGTSLDWDVGMVIRKCVFLNFANKDIILGWVSSHIGIRDNDNADCCQVWFGFASFQGWYTLN